MTRVLFMGRKNIAANMLQWLTTIPSVEVVGVLTDSHLKGSPTHMIAENLGYPIYSFEHALTALRAGDLVFDLGISILYWRKFKDEFLSVPTMGIINFHPAPLPDYKGTGGYNFAILDGCSNWGVSAHYVDEEIDAGPIIKVLRFGIDKEQETCVSLEKKSKEKLEELVMHVITKLLIYKEELPRQSNVGGRYITRQEMEQAKKIKLGDDIERKVRAFWFPPYEGAYIEIDGQHFTLVSRGILSRLVANSFVEKSTHDAAAAKIKPGDDINKKINTFWSPPHDGAYVEMDGKRFTLVNDEILSTLSPPGTTSLFTTQFSTFDE